VPQEEGAISVFFAIIGIGFNGVLFNRNVFDSCMKTLQYFRMNNISLESTFHWLSKDTVKFKVDVEFARNMQKCNSQHMQNSLLINVTSWQ